MLDNRKCRDKYFGKSCFLEFSVIVKVMSRGDVLDASEIYKEIRAEQERLPRRQSNQNRDTSSSRAMAKVKPQQVPTDLDQVGRHLLWFHPCHSKNGRLIRLSVGQSFLLSTDFLINLKSI